MDKIAKILLEIKAVFIRPNNFFTFTSGVKSPIYCDNRLILSYPRQKDKIIKALVDLIKNQYPDVEMIMGVATAGIPFATLIADQLNLPMGYVRSTAKKHGQANQIEGKLHNQIKVVIVEDLISTGKSILEVQKVLLKNQVNVIGSVAIFSYNVPSVKEKFLQSNLKLKTLTNFDNLIKTAIQHNYILKSDTKIIYDWKKEFDQS